MLIGYLHNEMDLPFRYGQPPYVIERSGVHYWEVWKGLPRDLRFEETKSRGGKRALMYLQSDTYIWVPPEAVEALENDPETIFLALLQRSRKWNDSEMNVRFLVPQEQTLEDVMAHADELNKDLIDTRWKNRSDNID